MIVSRKIDIAIPTESGWLQGLVDATAPLFGVPRNYLPCPGLRVVTRELTGLGSCLYFFYYKIDGQVMVFRAEPEPEVRTKVLEYMDAPNEPLASFFVVATYQGPGTRTDAQLIMATENDEYFGGTNRGEYVEKLRAAAVV